MTGAGQARLRDVEFSTSSLRASSSTEITIRRSGEESETTTLKSRQKHSGVALSASRSNRQSCFSHRYADDSPPAHRQGRASAPVRHSSLKSDGGSRGAAGPQTVRKGNFPTHPSSRRAGGRKWVSLIRTLKPNRDSGGGRMPVGVGGGNALQLSEKTSKLPTKTRARTRGRGTTADERVNDTKNRPLHGMIVAGGGGRSRRKGGRERIGLVVIPRSRRRFSWVVDRRQANRRSPPSVFDRVDFPRIRQCPSRQSGGNPKNSILGTRTFGKC